jgi:putative transposase
VKTVAEALGVARSNLIECLRGNSTPRRRHHKAQDAALAPLIKRLVDERPTYGYRRITALLRRDLEVRGEPPANHKRVYRIMQQHGLLLEKHSGRRPGRTHDGKIVVMRSNLRWCSDEFAFACWNAEIVRVAFVIDAHDREIIAWRAVCGAGVSGSHVRDMMLEAVENRCGAIRAPHSIEWLSDNGSPYTARETRDFAGQLNLIPCFTPVASPESNGLSEAFVRTFKRDYLRINPLPDATSALRQITAWFEDYNDNHPHSGLRMRSPREFIRARQPADVSA